MQNVQGGVTAAKGFKAAGIHCGIKRGKPDLALLISEVPATCAGTFTTNLVQGAPLKVTKGHLSRCNTVKAVIANSGNANACTGEQGLVDAETMSNLVAHELGCCSDQVLVASTGVIGVNLPMDKISRGIGLLASILENNCNTEGFGAMEAAKAILTTDTFPKECAVRVPIGTSTVHVGGMAKGSGMIHPNMATMLAFITTDASISKHLLEKALAGAVETSFNMITVDGDTSTNDMVLVLANGLSGNETITQENSDYTAFCQALEKVTKELAKLVAKDGEGATKLVEIRVKGARDTASARSIARSIARSNLVKTALFGEDANWGRILCAAGYSGVQFDVDQVEILLGDVVVASEGRGVLFDEGLAKEALGRSEVLITVSVGSGPGYASSWTCDLTFDYVKINASYRT